MQRVCMESESQVTFLNLGFPGEAEVQDGFAERTPIQASSFVFKGRGEDPDLSSPLPGP